MTTLCINKGCNRKVAKSGKYKLRPVCWKCHEASYGKRPLEEGVCHSQRKITVKTLMVDLVTSVLPTFRIQVL